MSTERPDQTSDSAARMTFEQALGKLDETVRALEEGGLPLAEATRLYEHGMKLARLCNEMLTAAELKISRVKTAYGEQMRLVQEEEPGTQD